MMTSILARGWARGDHGLCNSTRRPPLMALHDFHRATTAFKRGSTHVGGERFFDGRCCVNSFCIEQVEHVWGEGAVGRRKRLGPTQSQHSFDGANGGGAQLDRVDHHSRRVA